MEHLLVIHYVLLVVAGWLVVGILALPSHGGAPDRWFSPGIHGRDG
jgi:hypothetical protein